MAIAVKDENIRIEKLELGPLGTNAYLLTCCRTGDSVIVDAPAEVNTIAESLTGTNPRYILLTHNHLDHISALPGLHSILRTPLAAHAADSGNLSPPPEIQLKDGDIVSFGNIKLKVLHTPGHTPGSLCFMTGKYLIAGDTIFPGGPGRTGSPAALEQIIQSITGKIFVLADDIRIYPGHGESTVLKKEKEEFAIFSSRSHQPGLCGDVLWLSS